VSVGNRAVKPWPPGPAIGKVEVAKTGGVIRLALPELVETRQSAIHWPVVVMFLIDPMSKRTALEE
jgi:hypothetical protein